MKNKKIKRSKPKTTLEAINELETFFISDMWFSMNTEWQTERDMVKYLKKHFSILKKEVKATSSKK